MRIIDDSIGVMPSKDDDIDMYYACSINKEQNVIAAAIFSKHIDEIHLLVNQCDRDYSAYNGIPRHTIILDSLIENKEGVRSDVFSNYVIDNYGDADVLKGTRRIDTALKIIQVFHL